MISVYPNHTGIIISKIKYKAIILFLILVSGFTHNSFSQMSPSAVRSHWVFIVSEYIEWPKQLKTDKIIISIYGNSPDELKPITNLAKKSKINDKPVEIIHTKRLKDIKETHIIFVNNKYNDDLEQINNKLKGTGTLIITDRCEVDEYFMINLLLKGKNQQFEINSGRAYDANITISEKLLARGGTKVDLQGLYNKKEKQLAEKEKQLRVQEQKLNDKEDELIKQKEENEKQKQRNKLQAFELEKKQRELDSQTVRASLLFAEVEKQEIKLKQNQNILAKQEEKIEEKQELIELANEELSKKEKELIDREEKIKNQEETLNIQSDQIEQQKVVIYGAIAFGIFVLFMVFIIWRGYRMKKKSNMELTRKNEEINLQKEEIKTQAEQLEQINSELEKLSIVASKTQNAVIIMDRNGYFEWVNVGFTKLYGYTLQLLRNELDENIVNVSSNPSIRNILHRCVNTKQTVIYESVNNTRDGKNIWVQTTLTPILDDDDNVIRLIAIDADINKLKEQEQAIRQQSEELQVQKDELIIQKEQIEEQNKHIKSSIRYAQTIQKTILPVKSNIDSTFDSFIIFKPKDIVSGDFYWFLKMEVDNYIFIAAVDCTGHGVPGAFMSLIGNRLLNEIVGERNIYSPKEILERLNKNVVKALKQQQSDNNDGMDLCLARIEPLDDNKHKLTFSGAKRPLYFHHSKDNITGLLKGDRKSIGGVRARRSNVTFTNQEIILEQNDIFYLTSDGMIDQNDPNRKRYGSTNFMKLIRSIANKPLTDQKHIIESELAAFQKNEDQRDDITILGLQIK